jgi:class 3 adenylate cyclase
VREPCQVFILLETLYKYVSVECYSHLLILSYRFPHHHAFFVYRAFDDIARRRRVYKVETIGDCYVAVTGLPDPRPDHAVAMARFARDCMQQAHIMTKRLEVKLGPDTSELDMRIGLHSGQVTGGVLRGERSRFQLFGDTVNTAARMEHTGAKGKIQISQGKLRAYIFHYLGLHHKSY